MNGDNQIQASIGHVGIEVSNLSKAKMFYKTLLGELDFKIIMETPDVIGFSNQNFQVWVYQPPEPRIKRKAPTGEEFIIADHLAIIVSDRKKVDALEKEMEKNGFKALFLCEEHPQFEPGYYAVSFCDPDNYVIEIYNTSEPKQF